MKNKWKKPFFASRTAGKRKQGRVFGTLTRERKQSRGAEPPAAEQSRGPEPLAAEPEQNWETGQTAGSPPVQESSAAPAPKAAGMANLSEAAGTKLSFIEEKLHLGEVIRVLEDEKVRSRLFLVFELLLAIVLGVLTAIVMFKTVTMSESSMEPTISIGDRFLINQAAYRIGDVKRGDIVVFRTNGNDDAALHISRVIGLPGETVQILGGRIYIDEELYTESYTFEPIKNPGLAGEEVDLGMGEYFVLGDNRNNSDDSRFSDIGKVQKKYLVGKIWFQIAPPSDIGGVP